LVVIPNPSISDQKDAAATFGKAMDLSSEFVIDWAQSGHILRSHYEYGLFIGNEIAKIIRSQVTGSWVYDFLGRLTKAEGRRGREVKFGLTLEETGRPLDKQQQLVFWRAARAELGRRMQL
jgi:hypothetical protein